MTKTQDKTKNYYDAIARGYKNLYHEEQIKKISLIKDYLPKEDTLTLDLGSGDGVLNQFLKQSNIISLDLSSELLKLNNNSNKINASAQNLPLKNNIFDFVICLTAIQDMPDSKLAIEEVKRVLKNKSTFILTYLKVSSKKDIIEKEIKNNFKIIKKHEEFKDMIWVLEKK